MPRFVLTFDSFQDPGPAEMRALVAELALLAIVDQFPGALLVEGQEQDVVTALLKVPGWTWSAAVEVPVPSRTVVRE